MNLDCSNSGGIVQYCSLKLSSEALVGVKLSGLMCCVIQHLCILPYHLHYVYAFGRQTLQCIQDTFYLYACPLGMEHMTLALLCSTSLATGTTISICRLQFWFYCHGEGHEKALSL